jgi:hypothetical protein
LFSGNFWVVTVPLVVLLLAKEAEEVKEGLVERSRIAHSYEALVVG